MELLFKGFGTLFLVTVALWLLLAIFYVWVEIADRYSFIKERKLWVEVYSAALLSLTALATEGMVVSFILELWR